MSLEQELPQGIKFSHHVVVEGGALSEWGNCLSYAVGVQGDIKIGDTVS